MIDLRSWNEDVTAENEDRNRTSSVNLKKIVQLAFSTGSAAQGKSMKKGEIPFISMSLAAVRLKLHKTCDFDSEWRGVLYNHSWNQPPSTTRKGLKLCYDDKRLFRCNSKFVCQQEFSRKQHRLAMPEFWRRKTQHFFQSEGGRHVFVSEN